MKPMLCQKLTPDEASVVCASGDWIIQQKFDGVRAVIIGGKLYDRREKDITAQFPEFEGIAGLLGFPPIDGEIVAQSGEFNDVSGRVHLRDKLFISISAKKSPAKFVAFDVVLPLIQARERFSTLRAMELPPWCETAVDLKDFKKGWEAVEAGGWEGLVVKRGAGRYVEGLRSPDQLKVKAFVETTATFVKFEVTPRGITIETVDGRRVVVNGAQSIDVRRRIETNGSVIAEIQYLPQKGSEAWRFPSFRGVV